MKIEILMGSPNREGSTNILVENFIKGAEEAGIPNRLTGWEEAFDKFIELAERINK